MSFFHVRSNQIREIFQAVVTLVTLIDFIVELHILFFILICTVPDVFLGLLTDLLHLFHGVVEYVLLVDGE